MLQFTTLTVLLVLSFAVVKAQEGCLGDLCSRDNCPRYWSAECTVSPSPECKVTFEWRGSDVTGRCDARLCDARTCKVNRECMEEVFPPSCPEDKPNCRQVLRSRCVLQPFPHPMTCNDIDCGVGMECHFRERGNDFRPVVRCIPSVPDTCEEITCADGTMCVLRGRSKPTCVPVPTTEPTNLMFAETCDDLSCPMDQGCLTTNIPSESIEYAQCSPLEVISGIQQAIETVLNRPTCDSMSCPDGQECFNVQQGATIVFPICLTVSCTSDSDCGVDEQCIAQGNDNSAFVCAPVDVMAVTGTETCVESERVCPESTVCHETYSNDEIIGTICAIPSGFGNFGRTCDEVTCIGDSGCVASTLPNRETFAQCLANFGKFLSDLIVGLRMAGLEFGDN